MKAFRITTIQTVRRTYVVQAADSVEAVRRVRFDEEIHVEEDSTPEAIQHVLPEPSSH